MTLKGNLEVLNLSDIFQTLSLNKHTGTLKVDDGNREKYIYFSEGEISILSSSEKRKKLGELLVAAGLLTRHDLDWALDLQRQQGDVRLGEILVAEGLVDEEDVAAVVQQQIEEEIYELFRWNNADFEFLVDYRHPDAEDVPFYQTRLKFNTNSLIMEALRRIDEWEIINEEIPDIESEVFEVADGADISDLDAMDHPERVKRDFNLINGERNVADIISRSTASAFEVCQFIKDLKVEGLIEPLPPKELAKKAEAAFDENKYRPACMLYERLVHHVPTDTEIRWNLAACYRVLGKRDEAVSEYMHLAEHAEKRRNMDMFMRAANHILTLDPERTDIQEKIERIQAAQRRKERIKFVMRLVIGLVAVGGIGFLAIKAGGLERPIQRFVYEKILGKPLPLSEEELNAQAEALVKKAVEAEKEGDYPKAYRIYLQVVGEDSKYRETATAETVKLPIEVVSTPPGARVVINEREVGKTPVQTNYFPSKGLHVMVYNRDRVVYDKRAPGDFSATPPSPLTLVIPLYREPTVKQVAGAPISGPPFVWRKELYFISRNGRMNNVPQNQKLTFTKIGVLGDNYSPAVEHKSKAYFGSSHGEIRSVDLQTLSLDDEPVFVPEPRAGIVAPVVFAPEENRVFVFSENGNIYFLDEDFDEIAVRRTGNRLVRAGVSEGGKLYVGGTDNILREYGVRDGSYGWLYDAGADIVTTPLLAGQLLYIGAADNTVHVVNRVDGSRVKRITGLRGQASEGFTLSNGRVYFVTTGGRVVCVDGETGKKMWDRTFPDESLVGPPVVAANHVFVGGRRGFIYAVSIHGEHDVTWQANLKAAIETAPLLHNNILYVGGEDGTLYGVDIR